VIGAVAFSHWVLDLLVHRADMPILPGNAGGLPLLGLGLWATPALSLALEAALVVAGIVLYYRAAMSLPMPAGVEPGAARQRRLLASGVLAGLLAASLVTSALGIA
jgi:hypothetical protein